MMGINLLDFAKSQINQETVKKAAGLLGEKEGATQKAIDTLLTAVLGGMVNQATTLSNADNLLGIINQSSHNGNLLHSSNALLENISKPKALQDTGNQYAQTLFGSKIGSIVQWVATHTAVKTASATSLLHLTYTHYTGNAAFEENVEESDY